MNMLSTALLAYLELGLVLAVAYLLLRAARRSMHRHIDPSGMIGAGRLLFAATLLAPLMAHGMLSLQLPGLGRDAVAGAGADELSRLVAALSGMLSTVPTAETGAAGLDPSGLRLVAQLLGGLLAVGVAISAAATLRRLARLYQVIRSSVPLRRIGRVSVVVSDRATVPFSTAIFGKAHVVVPVWMMRDPQLLRVSICHELQHYRRHDPLWSVAFELIRILYFWNPAAYGWTRELSDLQELACDEAVIRRGVRAGDYGNCLLRVAEMAVARRVVASTAMATTSDRGVHLRRRIDMLFRNPSPFRSRRRALGLALTGALLLILVATTTAANWPDLPAATVIAAPAAAAMEHDPDCDQDCPDCEDCADCADCPDCKDAAPLALDRELPDLEFESASGDRVRLADLRGRVVLVDFWADWCKFCKAEAPQMKALSQQLAGQEIQLLGVSLSKTPEDTDAFVAEHGFDWPQLHAEGGWKSEAGAAFEIKGVPSRYLIDRAGQVTLLPRGNPDRMVRMILDAVEGNNVVAELR